MLDCLRLKFFVGKLAMADPFSGNLIFQISKKSEKHEVSRIASQKSFYQCKKHFLCFVPSMSQNLR